MHAYALALHWLNVVPFPVVGIVDFEIPSSRRQGLDTLTD
jgi:hypothetical protein